MELRLILYFFIFLLFFLILFSRFLLNSSQYGTYETEVTQCQNITGSCVEPGFQTTIKRCKKNPKTGLGCIDPQGDLSYADIISKSSCKMNCLRSVWEEEPQTELTNVCRVRIAESESDAMLLDSQCIPRNDPNFSPDTSGTVFGLKRRIFNCVPNDIGTNGQNGCTAINLQTILSQDFSATPLNIARSKTYSIGDTLIIDSLCTDFISPDCGILSVFSADNTSQTGAVLNNTSINECKFDITRDINIIDNIDYDPNFPINMYLRALYEPFNCVTSNGVFPQPNIASNQDKLLCLPIGADTECTNAYYSDSLSINTDIITLGSNFSPNPLLCDNTFIDANGAPLTGKCQRFIINNVPYFGNTYCVLDIFTRYLNKPFVMMADKLGILSGINSSTPNYSDVIISKFKTYTTNYHVADMLAGIIYPTTQPWDGTTYYDYFDPNVPLTAYSTKYFYNFFDASSQTAMVSSICNTGLLPQYTNMNYLRANLTNDTSLFTQPQEKIALEMLFNSIVYNGISLPAQDPFPMADPSGTFTISSPIGHVFGVYGDYYMATTLGYSLGDINYTSFINKRYIGDSCGNIIGSQTGAPPLYYTDYQNSFNFLAGALYTSATITAQDCIMAKMLMSNFSTQSKDSSGNTITTIPDVYVAILQFNNGADAGLHLKKIDDFGHSVAPDILPYFLAFFVDIEWEDLKKRVSSTTRTDQLLTPVVINNTTYNVPSVLNVLLNNTNCCAP